MIDSAQLKAEYDRTANRLIEEGMLGSGLHEDLLIGSSKWFCERVGRHGLCLADYFAVALENQIVLIFALPYVVADEEAADDLFDFLQHLTAWIKQLPGALLRKNGDRLVLVVGYRGGSGELGAHVMRRGGPSIVFWQPFATIRKNLNEPSYTRLSSQIGKTLVHEVVGHQLAFCSPVGPMVTRENLADILRIAGIHMVKLDDDSEMSVSEFVRQEDILAAIRRTKYIESVRHPDRYYANVTELIAFAVEGEPDQSFYDYAEIRKVLRGSLLLEQYPCAGHGIAVFRTHDLSTVPFSHAFVFRNGAAWTETKVIDRNGTALVLAECTQAYLRQANSPDLPDYTTDILPGQSLDIRLPLDAMTATVQDQSLLLTPFGVFERSGDDCRMLPESWQRASHAGEFRPREHENGVVALSNTGNEQIKAGFRRLNCCAPSPGSAS